MGILLTYDVTDERSFNSKDSTLRSLFFSSSSSSSSNPISPSLDIRNWIRNIEQHATEGVNKILVGNKCDMLDKKVINKEQGQALADEYGIKFIETSAKSNIGKRKEKELKEGFYLKHGKSLYNSPLFGSQVWKRPSLLWLGRN